MKVSPHRRQSSGPSDGFTLLELVIALLLIALLVGMVFATARSSLVLGNTVVKTQNEEMLNQAFFDLLENRFGSLPGNT
ncbi:MAG: prepilin-type N-terminal cleavage/methylation domain-containing protein, partial [Armatimonadetes bacterium]|nr:prepilin-type N-terminal cleavage/methylation domain-containing protein [Akkermansiaceae bacterium]